MKYFACGLFAIAACSCSEADEPTPDSPGTQAPAAIAVSLKGNTYSSTRTAVVDPEENGGKAVQHVTRVQLYIFEADGTGDFTCVASEDIKWSHLDGAMNGLGTLSQKYNTLYQEYKPEVEYKFIALGFDDTYTLSGGEPIFDGKNSVEAFGNPDAIIEVGKKLSQNKYFRLQDEKEVNLLNGAETFAGAMTYYGAEIKNGTASSRPIELYRRVAGIVGYFTNIPEKVNDTEVGGIALRTWQNQNTENYYLPLLPEGYGQPGDVEDKYYLDFKTSPSKATDSDIISRYDLAGNEGKDEVVTLSAYVLPMAASELLGVSTLYLDFLDKEGKSISGSRRRIFYSVASTRSGIGIIDPSEGEPDDSPAMHYPLRANQFYRLGGKGNAIDLSGNTGYILIEIDPIWDEYYGGALDNDYFGPDGEGGNESSEGSKPGLGIDFSWGEHPGGALDK